QGAQMATFLGLSGVGDLMATGASRLSRNYRVGYALGQGQSLPEILAQLGQVAEGVPTTRVLHHLAGRCTVEMPLCAALHSVLYERRPAPEVIRELLLRPAKDE
ncbi:MAG TPA: NAD(P)H-dependent glycerol-3-phosphate dehydrogenase, partial [Chthonomonadaceae bacterium]|nr:NAD(P)H-dependent glycerol-3-phosphate dehydrogenase [Chthonomonadaceae bacterium]